VQKKWKTYLKIWRALANIVVFNSYAERAIKSRLVVQFTHPALIDSKAAGTGHPRLSGPANADLLGQILGDLTSATLAWRISDCAEYFKCDQKEQNVDGSLVEYLTVRLHV
jgi:hypothetical protein